MKSFLKYFLMLFVANAQAAAKQDLTSQAFDVLGKSVRLKENRVLDQNNFGPAIKELTRILNNRYHLPIQIRPAIPGEGTSPFIQNLIDHPESKTEFTRKEIDDIYTYVENKLYCKASLIPLACTIGIYLSNLNQQTKQPNSDLTFTEEYLENLNEDLKKIVSLLKTLIDSPTLTTEDLNQLHTIILHVNDQKTTIQITLSGIIFRLSDVQEIEKCLEKGGNPMIICSYSLLDPKNPKKIEKEGEPAGIFALENQNSLKIIKKIKEKYSSFPVQIKHEKKVIKLIYKNTEKYIDNRKK